MKLINYCKQILPIQTKQFIWLQGSAIKSLFLKRPKPDNRLAENLTQQILHSMSGWTDVTWRGLPILKFPTDLWSYYEILRDTEPDLIIEIGTHHGGSAVFFLDICGLLGLNTEIITVDIKRWEPTLEYHDMHRIIGSSLDPDVISRIDMARKSYKKAMVVLDGDHHRLTVLKELQIYSKFVSKGCYLVAEDTCSQYADGGPGNAVQEFLQENKDNWTVDRSKERFALTTNPGGYLKKL